MLECVSRRRRLPNVLRVVRLNRAAYDGEPIADTPAPAVVAPGGIADEAELAPSETTSESGEGTDRSPFRRYAEALLPIVGVAVVYYLTARLGLLQELVRGQVTPYWPPTGVALVALLVLGLRIWPGIALGAFVLNATIGSSLVAAALITVGNTLVPVCAYLLLRRADFRATIDRRRDALALVFLGALAATLLSATIGSTALLLTDAIRTGDFWPTWSVWWTGDAMGVLVVTPFLLVILTKLRIPRGVAWYRWFEAACLFTGTFLVTLLAMTSSYEVTFLVFPFLIWAALRFQMIGAAPCALIVSTVAIVAAANESGPFARHDLFANMVTLQAFNGTTALTALLLAAIIAERNIAYDQVERAVTQLTTLLGQLDRGRTNIELQVSAPPVLETEKKT
jgi:integral membrane sensor domain MASE1